ncbi:Uncharacterised protein [Vibrio cholerae]|nr:Uncharacterised protein [Vibrio cholerae]CSI79466.1 Uncharacterised protein [Vibrio cholerae]
MPSSSSIRISRIILAKNSMANVCIRCLGITLLCLNQYQTLIGLT